MAQRARAANKAVGGLPEFPITTALTVENALGFTLSGELHNAAVRQLLFHGGRLPYEPLVTFLTVVAGRLGGTYLDIGANLGYCSLVAASASETPIAVHAFEPSFANFYWLRRNIAENRKARQVTPYLVGLGEVDGTAKLSDYGTGSSFVRGWDHGAADTHGANDVPVRRLDSLVGDARLSAPTVAKIDVEGYELPVLRGGERTLSHRDAVCVLCEINHGLHPDGFNPDAAITVRTLQSYGYRCFGASVLEAPGEETPRLVVTSAADVDMTVDGVDAWPDLWVGLRLDGDGGFGRQFLSSLALFPLFLQFYPAPLDLLREALDGME